MQLFHRVYGSGKPVVILHGLFGSSDNWMTQARMLGEHYSVYTIDLRNHGLSPHNDRHDYEAMAEDVRAFIKTQNLVPAAVIGHSMGGKVAMKLAIDHPELVSKLVVVDIVPKVYPPHHNRIVEGLLSLHPENLTTRQEADEKLSAFVTQPDVRQFLLKNLSRKPEGGFSWKINLKVIADNMEDVLGDPVHGPAFMGPVLFLMGSRSDYFKPGDEVRISNHFPDNRIDFLDTGHWLQAEQPKAFVKKVSEFLLKENNK
ncbi:MAG: alpha/beta fold hydrolase [Cyclobacteriaceae bacterium]